MQTPFLKRTIGNSDQISVIVAEEVEAFVGALAVAFGFAYLVEVLGANGRGAVLPRDAYAALYDQIEEVKRMLYRFMQFEPTRADGRQPSPAQFLFGSDSAGLSERTPFLGSTRLPSRFPVGWAATKAVPTTRREPRWRK